MLANGKLCEMVGFDLYANREARSISQICKILLTIGTGTYVDPDGPAIRVRLGIPSAVLVQPGCTNLSLRALFPSKTSAYHRGRGRRPHTNRAWQAFTHTLIAGEHTANVNSPREISGDWGRRREGE